MKKIQLSPLARHEVYLRLYDILSNVSIVKDNTDKYLRLERKLAAKLISIWRQKYNDELKKIFASLPSSINQQALKIITDGLSSALGLELGKSENVKKIFHDYIQKT